MGGAGKAGGAIRRDEDGTPGKEDGGRLGGSTLVTTQSKEALARLLSEIHVSRERAPPFTSFWMQTWEGSHMVPG